MARSHHRKAHKDHLRQFQNSRGESNKVRQTKTTGTLVVIGIILGLAIGYFSSGADPLWISIAGIIGGLIGYVIGRLFDKDVNK